MLQVKNSKNHYGLIAIFLHWLIALIVFVLLPLGIYMTYLPISYQKLKLYGWHKEYGILILMLIIVRMFWRLVNIQPLLPTYLPNWQKLAARAVHYSFYIFLLVLPISGWLITSAVNLPVSFFGIVIFPNLISPNQNLLPLFISIHKWLGYILIAIICLHVSAALKHHFINKDDVLRRMLP